MPVSDTAGPGTENPARVVMFTRRECSLCDQLRFALDMMSARLCIVYEQTDVDTDPALAARYGDTVPVLKVGQHTVVAGHFDIETLEQRLRAAIA